ncbi:Photoreceptor dehydrogenase [Carabus blaptoides fortunei]
MDPKGKCAIITGAASGLGLAITRELLKNGLQTVMMADINKELGEQVCNDLDKEFETSHVRFTHMDVTKDEDYERVFKKAKRICGSIDIVVNNAGIVDDIDYEKQLAVNIGGVIRGTLLGLQYMGKDKLGQGGGIIMNMASVSAVQPLDAVPVYSATKAAILALSRSFGTRYHYNRTGVRVVTLCPAFTETPLLSTNKVFTDCQPAYTKLKESYVSQKPESVGLAAIYIIKNAESESAWVVESNKLHKLQMPFWKDMCSYVEEYSPGLSRL